MGQIPDPTPPADQTPIPPPQGFYNNPTMHQAFQAMPKLDSPLIDQVSGFVSIPWYQFFVRLWQGIQILPTYGVEQAGQTFLLPANPFLDQLVVVIDGSGQAAASHITVDGNGNEILNSPTYTINQNYGSVTLVWNGVFWSVTGSYP